MTDEAKALVERLRWSHWCYEDAGENTSYTSEAPLEAANLIETQAREIERLRGALEFYADKQAWNQPPVKTIAHALLGPAYENASSKVRMDRGKIARAALKG